MSGKKAKGKRAKTRDLFKHRGSKTTVSRKMDSFSNGQVVQVSIDGSTHAGLPFRRHQGVTGVVTGRQGKAFMVSARHGKQPVMLVTTAAHLKRLN